LVQPSSDVPHGHGSPYFTSTYSLAQDTSSSYISRQSGGTSACSSELGREPAYFLPCAEDRSFSSSGGDAQWNQSRLPQCMLRVLVAEDNPLCQAVVTRMLTKYGCKVDVANDGQQAVRMWTRKPAE
jgi:hypothetical protein